MIEDLGLSTSDATLALAISLAAFLYSSVGHGGASAYLALMTFWEIPVAQKKSSALIMNCVVSLIASLMYARKTILKKQLFLWLILGSIPASFIGAKFELHEDLYRKILAVILIVPSLQLLFGQARALTTRIPQNALMAVGFGALIGLLSGMIGIGGGILLSPLLILIAWAEVKETALISALFIFVNSVSGLVSQAMHGLTLSPNVMVLACCAIVGGLLGSFVGSRQLNTHRLRQLLGFVVLIAGVTLYTK